LILEFKKIDLSITFAESSTCTLQLKNMVHAQDVQDTAKNKEVVLQKS
jgi:hypothetical protein